MCIYLCSIMHIFIVYESQHPKISSYCPKARSIDYRFDVWHFDGLDIALCRFSGTGMESEIELLQFETIPYTSDYKTEIASVFSKREVNLEKLCLLNGWVAQQHAFMILQCLQK